jgi:hypothetical protein
MSKKPDREEQEVTHIVDFDSNPSFEMMGKLEITKREEGANKVVLRQKKRERSML